MLRRKLMMVFGSLVVLIVAVALVTMVLLHSMLRDLDHINDQAVAVVDATNRLSTGISAVEVELYRLRLGQARHLDPLIDQVEALRAQGRALGGHYLARRPEAAEPYGRLMAGLPVFERHVGSLATAQDPVLARQHNLAALGSAMELRRSVQELDRAARDHARRELTDLAGQFRRVSLGMALGGLLLINASILLLLRAAAMVLRPVDRLVHASRQWAQDRFDYRAPLDQDSEFRELAQAYNRLAERLQGNEHRKLEMLGQVAVTMNHELNNAMATIETQLQLLSRQAGGDGKVKLCLQQIRDNLQRMTGTVESLKRVRRIVLTDYMAGMQMLDLEQSIEAAAAPAGAAPSGGSTAPDSGPASRT